jgi:hypothetical protein
MAARWSRAARDLLFQELVSQFGALDGWEEPYSPGHGRDEKYRRFLESFADLMGTGPRAVEMQVRFGSGVEGNAHWRQGHSLTAILCLAAAYDAGFIGIADFPNLEATSKRIRSAS